MGHLSRHLPYVEEMIKIQKSKDALASTDTLTTLNNTGGREAEHHQLMREQGFPSEQPLEGARYQKYAEIETDVKGKVIHNRPPWIVNEASEMLYEVPDDDAPSYKEFAPKAANKSKNAEGENVKMKKSLMKQLDDMRKDLTKAAEDWPAVISENGRLTPNGAKRYGLHPDSIDTFERYQTEEGRHSKWGRPNQTDSDDAKSFINIPEYRALYGGPDGTGDAGLKASMEGTNPFTSTDENLRHYSDEHMTAQNNAMKAGWIPGDMSEDNHAIAMQHHNQISNKAKQSQQASDSQNPAKTPRYDNPYLHSQIEGSNMNKSIFTQLQNIAKAMDNILKAPFDAGTEARSASQPTTRPVRSRSRSAGVGMEGDVGSRGITTSRTSSAAPSNVRPTTYQEPTATSTRTAAPVTQPGEINTGSGAARSGGGAASSAATRTPINERAGGGASSFGGSGTPSNVPTIRRQSSTRTPINERAGGGASSFGGSGTPSNVPTPRPREESVTTAPSAVPWQTRYEQGREGESGLFNPEDMYRPTPAPDAYPGPGGGAGAVAIGEATRSATGAVGDFAVGNRGPIEDPNPNDWMNNRGGGRRTIVEGDMEKSLIKRLANLQKSQGRMLRKQGPGMEGDVGGVKPPRGRMPSIGGPAPSPRMGGGAMGAMGRGAAAGGRQARATPPMRGAGMAAGGRQRPRSNARPSARKPGQTGMGSQGMGEIG